MRELEFKQKNKQQNKRQPLLKIQPAVRPLAKVFLDADSQSSQTVLLIKLQTGD
jgi:hypothetical protein